MYSIYICYIQYTAHTHTYTHIHSDFWMLVTSFAVQHLFQIIYNLIRTHCLYPCVGLHYVCPRNGHGSKFLEPNPSNLHPHPTHAGNRVT